MSDREKKLQLWLKELFPGQEPDWQKASEDASFRRYLRLSGVNGKASRIIMDAPPERENSSEFIRIARWLYSHQLNVPEIIAENLSEGFLLLSDLGTTHYLAVLNENNADTLYKQALDSLIAMQLAWQKAALELPVYDSQRLQLEMDLFPEWYLGRHLGKNLDTSEAQQLQQCFDFLLKAAGMQPTGFVHRDYHSRNLMYQHAQAPGILDFQDALCGPLTYDAVSLLRDCYICWPEERMLGWLDYYRQSLINNKIMEPVSLEVFSRWFDLMGLQRHLKVLGIFARLYHRDGKSAYLADLPQTLDYALQVSGRYPELQFLQQLLLSSREPL